MLTRTVLIHSQTTEHLNQEHPVQAHLRRPLFCVLRCGRHRLHLAVCQLGDPVGEGLACRQEASGRCWHVQRVELHRAVTAARSCQTRCAGASGCHSLLSRSCKAARG